MTGPANNTRASVGLIVLGIPGVALFLGGLFMWFVMASGFAFGVIDWASLSRAPRERLIPFLVSVPLSPFIGYTMIVFAANMMGIQRYHLPPKQAVIQALLDATHLAIVSLVICALILTLSPWGGYPTLHTPTLVSCATAIPIAWFIRRLAQKKQQEWREPSFGISPT